MVKDLKLVLALFLLSFAAHSHTHTELPALNASPDHTSISGLSSGAFMAAQFHVAFSEDLVGAGIVAGGPWNCAAYNIFGNPVVNPFFNATTSCMNPCKLNPLCNDSVFPNSGYLVDLAEDKAKAGEIDSLEHLVNDQVYIFSGESDETVLTGVVNTTQEFYQKVGLDKAQILYNKKVDAGHAFITADPKDTKCAITQPPFINNCDIHQATNIFKHIYGPQNPAAEEPKGELIEFNQSEFFNNPLISMNDTAYVYVPENCASGKERCKVHVAVHGCEQGASVIGTTYVKGTGYIEIADTNSTIVLFPQAKKSPLMPYNPKGCWDFWGYTSGNVPPFTYYSKKAPQMVAIKKMIERLTSDPKKLANK